MDRKSDILHILFKNIFFKFKVKENVMTFLLAIADCNTIIIIVHLSLLAYSFVVGKSDIKVLGTSNSLVLVFLSICSLKRLAMA